MQKFEEELRIQQTNVDKIRYLAEEILQSCHPNAVRMVKYYLTITQTRWEQVSAFELSTYSPIRIYFIITYTATLSLITTKISKILT